MLVGGEQGPEYFESKSIFPVKNCSSDVRDCFGAGGTGDDSGQQRWQLGCCGAEGRVLSTSLSKPADRAQAQPPVLLLLPWEQEARLCPLAADSLRGLIRDRI